MTQTTMLDHALALASQGFEVILLQPSGKEPYPHMRGFLDATSDPETIRRMFSVPGAENSNIGIRPPLGVVVVDVDKRHNGLEAISKLEAEGKELPETRTVRTGGGGLHAYYTAPAELSWPKEIVHGVDLKAHSGYLVAPPSTHESGNKYEWVDTRPMAAAPAWLVALGRPKNETTRVVVIDEGESESMADEVIAATASAFEPNYTEGKKHYLAFEGGAWLRSRGYNQSDIARVFELLPSKNPRARVKDALDGYKADTTGWDALCKLIGKEAADALDNATPNPKRAAEQAGAAAVAEGAAAGAVERPERAPLIFAAPAAAVTYEALVQAIGVDVDLSAVSPPRNYLVPALELGHGRLNMVVGYGNAGKTMLVQAQAFAIAMGLPVWGQFPARRCKVLHLDFEAGESVRENYQRLANAYRVPHSEVSQWIKVIDGRTMLTDSDFERALTALISAGGFGLVVIDVMRAAVGGLDENKSEIAKPLYMLGRVSQATNAVVELLHHEKKPPEGKRVAAEHMISGHNSIHGALQVSLSMIRDDETGLIEVYGSKKVRKGFKPFSVRIVDVDDPNATAGAAIARANPDDNEPSWGVRVEVVGASAAAIAPGPNTKARALVPHVVELVREQPGQSQKTIVAVGHNDRKWGRNNTAEALRLAVSDGLVRERTRSEDGAKGYVIVPESRPWSAESVAPPRAVQVPNPPMAESMAIFEESLRAANEVGNK